MKDGNYIIYVIQARITHESPWLKPEGKLTRVKYVTDDAAWFFASFDHFGHVWEPHRGSGNNWRPVSPKSHDELHDVQRLTGRSGYFDLNYGLRALKRLCEADNKGKFDTKGPYGEKSRAARHEFRLIKLTMSQKTELVEMTDVVGAL